VVSAILYDTGQRAAKHVTMWNDSTSWRLSNHVVEFVKGTYQTQ